MEPNSFGRKIGMGVRIAGNIARERAAESARRSAERSAEETATAPSAAAWTPTVATQPAASTTASDELTQRGRELGRGVGRGTKSFGRSFLGPFAHAGNVLWLEITGCFFALFAAFFAQNVYMLRAQYAAGPLHQKFLLYTALTLVFLYFSGSSFVRARRKSRAQKLAGR